MNSDERVSFSGLIPFAGLISGVAIAVGLPYVTLVYGTSLTTAAQTGITILALVFGGGVTFCSAFFGIVVPRRIYNHPHRSGESRFRCGDPGGTRSKE